MTPSCGGVGPCKSLRGTVVLIDAILKKKSSAEDAGGGGGGVHSEICLEASVIVVRHWATPVGEWAELGWTLDRGSTHRARCSTPPPPQPQSEAEWPMSLLSGWCTFLGWMCSGPWTSPRYTAQGSGHCVGPCTLPRRATPSQKSHGAVGYHLIVRGQGRAVMVGRSGTAACARQHAIWANGHCPGGTCALQLPGVAARG